MAILELAAGTVIAARYRLERPLDRGGMSVLWVAEELASHERHALKFLKEPTDDPEARRRFVREARAAAAVRHPSVVRIIDVLELDDGMPVIAMELLEGESLRARLRRAGRLELGELADIALPAIAAVGTAHALGIVHRDLKPENIFLTRGAAGERAVKVVDFGIAKLTALDGEAAQSTGITTGAVLGTPTHMAPEQVFGETDLDHRVDVWALGLVIYECLSGALPTSAENVGQVLKNVLSRPFEPLDRLVPGIPPELAALVARMLSRDRAGRPDDLREVAGELAAWASAPAAAFGPPAGHLRPRAAEQDTRAGRPRRAPAGNQATSPGLGETGETAAARGDAATARSDAATARSDAATVATVAGGRSSGRTATPSDAIAETIDPLGATHRPAPGDRRLRWPRVAAAAVALATVATGGAIGARRCASQASPLAAPGARLACPVLRASGVEAPAGWLGAAAAVVACERARVVLGGRPDRTLAPADLLGLAREPRDDFPEDPYAAPAARERSLAAARQSAPAYLDGEVAWSTAGFSVQLALHAAGGAELARGAGTGRGLYEAVRDAMAPLIRGDAIPPASALAPEIARWARTDRIDDALGVLDLTFAVAHNAGGLPAECRRFAAAGARIPELGPEGRWLCALTLGEPDPGIALDATDRADAAVATRMRIEHTLRPGEPPAGVDLRAVFAHEAPWGKSFAAAIQSCLLGASDPRSALSWARLAVENAPGNPEGGTCNPWEQLVTLERDTAGAAGAVRAMQAWQPWNGYAWLQPGFRSGGNDPAALRLARRARVLSPLDAYLADNLAAGLLASGLREEASAVAAELRGGGLRLHRVESELIAVRVETSSARFGQALDHARRQAEPSDDDIGWVRTQRFEIAWYALELAALLGRPAEVADGMVARFLAPDPPRLESNFTAVPMRVAAICALSSAPDRCFARLRAVEPRLPGAVTAETTAFALGAERYTRGDLAGAARAWRPLLGGTTALPSVLAGAVVDAFQRTGADNLAEEVDREVMTRAGEFHGATPGHVRAAERAFARGDRDTARRLAEQVQRAWSVADEPPPGLARARRLLTQLDAR